MVPKEVKCNSRNSLKNSKYPQNFGGKDTESVQLLFNLGSPSKRSRAPRQERLSRTVPLVMSPKPIGWKFSMEMPLRIHSEQSTAGQWMIKSRIHRQQKKTVISWLTYETMRMRLQIPQGWPLLFKLTRLGKRKMDSDNLVICMKWIRDALADYFFPHLSKAVRDEHDLVSWEYSQEIGHEYGLRIDVTLNDSGKENDESPNQ